MQMMRMEHSNQDNCKMNQNASLKVNNVICKVVLPLLQSRLGDHVSFANHDSGEISREFIQSLREVDPGLLQSKDKFIECMSAAYDGLMPSSSSCNT